MPKGPKRTKPISKHSRRNPEAGHVQKWHAYRERKGRPKAMLEHTRGQLLTYERYETLIEAYASRAAKDLSKHKEKGRRDQRILGDLIMSPNVPLEKKREIMRALDSIHPQQIATVSRGRAGYEIAKEIIKDFGNTKGLRVFGFGVGYGQLLFFLKNFAGAKVKGVDAGYFSREFTRRKGLKVLHGVSAADFSLTKLGKFDITYSIDVFERDVINKDTAFEMFRNIAAMTRKGGKSYHIILTEGKVPFPKGEIETMANALGLRLDEWTERRYAGFFIKLTKVKSI